ncbi:MAG TPA: glucosaminidase domain-containing protein, partial [Anaerolineales bacterium]
SPAAGSGQALYDLGVEYGIDPVYALAFFLHEDSFGEAGIGAANHSLGNIRCSAGYSCQYGFRYYATWADSYRDWYSLILNGYVKGQITNSIVGHPCMSVDEIVPVYAPSSDHNDVTAYIAAIERAVKTWREGQVWV